MSVSLCVCADVRVSVFVSVCVCVCVCLCVCVCFSVCLWGGVGVRECESECMEVVGMCLCDKKIIKKKSSHVPAIASRSTPAT